MAADDFTDAQLSALRDEVFQRVESMPAGPRRMYDAGRFTGYMNALDPRSPHCTRDPVRVASFFALLLDEIHAYSVEVSPLPPPPQEKP